MCNCQNVWLWFFLLPSPTWLAITCSTCYATHLPSVTGCLGFKTFTTIKCGLSRENPIGNYGFHPTLYGAPLISRVVNIYETNQTNQILFCLRKLLCFPPWEEKGSCNPQTCTEYVQPNQKSPMKESTIKNEMKTVIKL